MKQDEVFLKSEGNSWYDRNKTVLTPEREDRVLKMVQECDFKPSTIIEVGCSNGWRLEKLRQMFNAECYGFDASLEAINAGKKQFPNLFLEQGGLAEYFSDKQFDLVICNFVLHWIDRANIIQAMTNIARLVSPGGMLVLSDFLPDYNQRRRYHHLPNQKIFTYKQDYAKFFVATGLFQEIVRKTSAHAVKGGAQVD
ncbi:MAG: class I SAM-dependent methyltransferase [Selenomonadaceae bacterium]|nr:class I SAM-dependent methyltransferase [Selenomonadaceae bacterium]